jgi:hypothetical protein
MLKYLNFTFGNNKNIFILNTSKQRERER